MSHGQAKPLFREGNKHSQWSFVLTSSFTNPENIKHLSNLHRKDVLYIVFVIDNDNCGNPYLEGFIKTTRRHRVSFIRKLVGPAIVDVVRDVPLTLANLHLKSEVHEFGDPSTARFSTYCNELALFKSEARNFSMERMQTSFPRLFQRFPQIVIPYLQNCQRQSCDDALPPTDEVRMAWYNLNRTESEYTNNSLLNIK